MGHGAGAGGGSTAAASGGGGEKAAGGAQLQPQPQPQPQPPPAAAAAAAAAKTTRTVVEVRNVDCLQEAATLISNSGGGGGGGGGRVAVLNMANAMTPGGGFRVGCGAQVRVLLLLLPVLYFIVVVLCCSVVLVSCRWLQTLRGWCLRARACVQPSTLQPLHLALTTLSERWHQTSLRNVYIPPVNHCVAPSSVVTPFITSRAGGEPAPTLGSASLP